MCVIGSYRDGNGAVQVGRVDLVDIVTVGGDVEHAVAGVEDDPGDNHVELRELEVVLRGAVSKGSKKTHSRDSTWAVTVQDGMSSL